MGHRDDGERRCRIPGHCGRGGALHRQHRRFRQQRQSAAPVLGLVEPVRLRRRQRRRTERRGDTSWTNYGTGNVNTSQVDSIITGATVIDKTLDYGEYIGQHNNGNHTALYGDVDTYLSGKDLPVPIVDHNGNFQGWAMFHVTSASGGATKKIYGYYETNFTSPNLSVGNCSLGACPRFLGSYVLKLVN